MAKLLGCLLVGIGFFSIGIWKKSELDRRRKLLADLENAFLILENEISAMMLPLPLAMRHAAVGTAKDFFERAADLIYEKGSVEGFVSAVEEWIFQEEEKEILSGYGMGIGAADTNGQLKNIKLCRQRLVIAHKKAAERCEVLGKLYINGSVMAGLLIIILFM